MGLILDSSVVIAAERRGETVEQLIARILHTTGDQDAALSAVGLTELVHGIYRAPTPEVRLRRESFLNELLADLTVYPYTNLRLHYLGRRQLGCKPVSFALRRTARSLKGSYMSSPACGG
jgi:predicted nucleic acid-binding protein